MFLIMINTVLQHRNYMSSHKNKVIETITLKNILCRCVAFLEKKLWYFFCFEFQS